MKSRPQQTPRAWSEAWIDAVAAGRATMSARSVARIETLGGGLKTVAALAKKRAVHLVMLEDDKGVLQVAASKKPFKVLA